MIINGKKIDGQFIRNTVLETINQLSKNNTHFQFSSVINEIEGKIRDYTGTTHINLEIEQAILAFIYDLFRNGHISWGYNFSNPQFPCCHLTEQGKKVLQNISRDPVNPDGYKAYLLNNFKLNPISLSYLEEALNTFNSGCFKSAAVMLGCASESLILEIRDNLIDKMNSLNKIPNKKLNDWKVKTVIEELKKEFDNSDLRNEKSLFENYQVYWSSFIHQIRISRNDAGHPSTIDLITYDSVYALFLVFPSVVKLTNELNDWIKQNYK